jgi:hypothetical protein
MGYAFALFNYVTYLERACFHVRPMPSKRSARSWFRVRARLSAGCS